MAVLTVGGLVSVRADGKGDALEQNRKWLEKARKDPEHYARLLQDLKAFLNLPPDQQDRLRKLDKELSQLQKKNPAESERLNRALERFAAWWERLSETDRQWIEAAPNQNERLRRIRALRERQWIEHLPKAYRDQIHQAQGEKRAALIKRYRQEEKDRHQEWQLAMRHWDEFLKGKPPRRTADLPPDVLAFVHKNLQPRLSKADADRLKAAEGKWPGYLEVLVDLSDRYVPFPGPLGPKSMADLPEDVRKQIAQLKPPARNLLQKAEGKWPEFAVQLQLLSRRTKLTLPRDLLPSKPGDFDRETTWFIRNRLLSHLTDEERQELKSVEGRWPEYPKALVRLASRHGLTDLPGILPGPRQYWDRYRSKPGGGTPVAGGQAS
jgi:hypothetical protein